MNREKLIKIIKDEVFGFDDFDNEVYGAEDCADRILAALAKEREGEVVLAEGLVYADSGGQVIGSSYCDDVMKSVIDKRGQLIFRPTKENV